MRFDRKSAAAGVAAACVWMGHADAAGSVTVSVTLTAGSLCLIAPPTAISISWGYDASAPTVTNSATVVYRCSTGVTPSFTVGSTAAGLVSGTYTIGYTASLGGVVAGTGLAAPQAKTATFTVTLNQTDADNAPPGTYAGSFVTTLTP